MSNPPGSREASGLPPKGVLQRLKRMLSLDLRALALLRIAYGLVLLQDLVVRATDLQAHYTDYGLAPRSAVLELNTNPGFL